MTARTGRSKIFIIILLFVVASLIDVQMLSSAALAQEEKNSNIIFILTDDQRLEDIKHMSKLNELLVHQGISFTNYFDTVSLCCPSRTSILRGQYAHNTGVLTNLEPTGGFAVANARGMEDSTLATWLRDAGYKTALIGKYLNGYPGAKGKQYVPPGWDYWASSVAGNAYSEYNYTLNENGKLVHYGDTADDYGTDVYAKKSVDFIKQCLSEKKPFFLYLAVYAPHGPATVAPRHMDLFQEAKIPRTSAFNEADVSKKPQFIQALNPISEKEIASADAYYAKRLRSLQAVDEAIARLYDTLKESGNLENTFIFFTSDNGFHLGEHRLRRGKQTAYETDIHLPLIVRGPGIKPGTTSSALVGNIDLAPTIATIAGAKIPDFVDGRSFVPLLHGADARSTKWRNAYLIEHWQSPPRAARRGGRRPRAEHGETVRVEGSAGGATPSSAEPAAGPKGGAPAGNIEGEAVAVEDEEPAPPSSSQAGGSAGGGARNSTAAVEQTSGPRGPGGGRRRRAIGAAAGGRRASRRAIPEFHGLRNSDSTYVEYVTDEKEYYHLKDDPDQVNNLAGNQSGSLKKMSERLERMIKAGGREIREAENEKQ